MNALALSFASLVKSNNGFFKSDKQASFLLSQCQDENTFTASGDVYGNQYQMIYHCDDKGIVKVEKHTPHTGITLVTFERHIEGVVNATEAAAKAKEGKRIAKEIKRLEKAIQERTAAKQSYIDGDMMSLYEESMVKDEESLKAYNGML